jgi:hypothetical protein
MMSYAAGQSVYDDLHHESQKLNNLNNTLDDIFSKL